MIRHAVAEGVSEATEKDRDRDRERPFGEKELSERDRERLESLRRGEGLHSLIKRTLISFCVARNVYSLETWITLRFESSYHHK